MGRPSLSTKCDLTGYRQHILHRIHLYAVIHVTLSPSQNLCTAWRCFLLSSDATLASELDWLLAQSSQSWQTDGALGHMFRSVTSTTAPLTAPIPMPMVNGLHTSCECSMALRHIELALSLATYQSHANKVSIHLSSVAAGHLQSSDDAIIP